MCSVQRHLLQLATCLLRIQFARALDTCGFSLLINLIFVRRWSFSSQSWWSSPPLSLTPSACIHCSYWNNCKTVKLQLSSLVFIHLPFHQHTFTVPAVVVPRLHSSGLPSAHIHCTCSCRPSSSFICPSISMHSQLLLEQL